MRLFPKVAEQKTFLLRALNDGQYAWAVSADGVMRGVAGRGELAAAAQAFAQSACDQLWLILPGTQATLWPVTLERKELRYASRVIPFRLEDQLLQDLDCLHFATGTLRAGPVAVAVVERERLRDHVSRLAEEGLRADACFPAQCLLPEGSLVCDSEGILFNLGGDAVAHALDASLAPEILPELLPADPGAVPVRCVIDADDAAKENARCLEPIAGSLRREDGSLLGLAARMTRAPEINLLQGEFAPRLDWARYWHVWRAAAVGVLVAALAHTLASSVEVWQLKANDRRLRAEIESEYRSVFPQGLLVDPRSQMRTQLQRLRGGEGGPGFLQLFFPVAETLQAGDALVLHSVRFDARNRELRLDLSLPTHQQVETLRAALGQHGSTAELLGSTASSGGVRARLALK